MASKRKFQPGDLVHVLHRGPKSKKGKIVKHMARRLYVVTMWDHAGPYTTYVSSHDMQLRVSPKGSTVVSFDWKVTPGSDDLTKALAPFGVFVYDDPSCEGTDSYGFVFSDRPLTDTDLAGLTSS